MTVITLKNKEVELSLTLEGSDGGGELVLQNLSAAEHGPCVFKVVSSSINTQSFGWASVSTYALTLKIIREGGEPGIEYPEQKFILSILNELGGIPQAIYLFEKNLGPLGTDGRCCPQPKSILS